MEYDSRLAELLDDLSIFQDWLTRFDYIISLGNRLPSLPEKYKTDDRLIEGCQSKVWLHAETQVAPDGRTVIHFSADSNSTIVKGLIAIFVRLLSDLPAEEIVQADLSKLSETGLQQQLAGTRSNALTEMTRKVKMLAVSLA